MAEAFDFIVIGTGAGGAPLACNLAEAGYRVLVLEAGGNHEKAKRGAELSRLAYDVPAFHSAATEDPNLSWRYFVDHYSDPETNRRCIHFEPRHGGIFYPRSGALGGCTTHHAMVMMAALSSDWNEIAQATGDASWKASRMRAYQDRVKGWLRIDQPDLIESSRATQGDEQLSRIFKQGLKAANEHGDKGLLGRSLGTVLRLLGNPNEPAPFGGAKTGAFLIPAATDGVEGSAKGKGYRGGTRERILSTMRKTGDRLTLWTDCLVNRVVFDENAHPPRAVGVEYMSGENLYEVDARAVSRVKAKEAYENRKTIYVRRGGEVIVSAGAFNTPQLLMLSGIGAPDKLERAGIEPMLDLPGVGENLQDHYEVAVVSKMRDAFTFFEQGTPTVPPEPDDPNFLRWKEKKTGLYATNGGVMGLILKSAQAKKEPDLFIFGFPGVFKGYYTGWSEDATRYPDRFSWVILKAGSNNKGQVFPRSDRPWEEPEVVFELFDDNEAPAKHPDIQALLEGLEFVRGMNRNVAEVIDEELVPGPKADLERYIRLGCWGHHASCTCKIGGDDDPMAVLDSDFRVRGTAGLRVVDASVFPRVPGYFPALPTMMVSEKASETILAELRKR